MLGRAKWAEIQTREQVERRRACGAEFAARRGPQDVGVECGPRLADHFAPACRRPAAMLRRAPPWSVVPWVGTTPLSAPWGKGGPPTTPQSRGRGEPRSWARHGHTSRRPKAEDDLSQDVPVARTTGHDAWGDGGAHFPPGWLGAACHLAAIQHMNRKLATGTAQDRKSVFPPSR